MEPIKIDLESAYQEVDIAGKIYKLDLTDGAMDRYLEIADDFKNISNDASAEQVREKLKKFFDCMLGANAYESIYADVKSSLIMCKIISQLLDVSLKKAEDVRKSIRSDYIPRNRDQQRQHSQRRNRYASH